MRPSIDELLQRIRALQDQLEEEYRKHREDFEQRRLDLADELLRQQRRYKIGLFRFLRSGSKHPKAEQRRAAVLSVPCPQR